MEDLPDKILRLIAREVLEKSDGMRLWCKLASTCTRLWSFQLPAEPVYILDNRVKKHGLPWALGRLRNACKLNLTVGRPDDDDKPHLVSDVARAVMQASHELTKLETLVRLFVLGP
ncbi:g6920 [Coccomyxa viridis]|uniref:G6920 protein n=1 Tax=Coccomyxa viridis TaxID=1274662 RepID=A0ABP1G346_9CHLO